MDQVKFDGRRTCESCDSLDVRLIRPDHLLEYGRRLNWTWHRGDEPTNAIGMEVQHDNVVLEYRVRLDSATEWKNIHQRVPIAWTACHLGGRRAWFICDVSVDGRHCGRRVAKLYRGGDVFACRHCYGLAYASQQQSPVDRSSNQAKSIRLRLGGSQCLFDPFPEKPRGMHWRRYLRLRSRADAAEEVVHRWVLKQGRRFLDRYSAKAKDVNVGSVS